jgi:hypothetical protein
MVVTSVIPALRRLRQEDGEFQSSLGYLVKPYLKETKQIYTKKEERKKE